MRTVTVCADDFGLTPGVSAGILECLAEKRISATSCMTARPYWRDWASKLRPFIQTADIGLHFTLTDQESLGEMPMLAPMRRLPPLSKILQLSLLRQLSRVEIEQELHRQLDAFEDALGAPPAHVDGHHHVHQLPGIRDVLVSTLRRRYREPPPYVRLSKDRLQRILRRGVEVQKAWAIGLFGSGLQKLASAAQIWTNDGFSGIYRFEQKYDLSVLFPRFLIDLGPGMLVMCHPGYSDRDLEKVDVVTAQREAELDYLLSSRWPDLLDCNALRVGRLPWNHSV